MAVFQTAFQENVTYPAGSVCFGYGIACNNATEHNGICPAVSFDGALVGVFGAFSSPAACTSAVQSLTTGLLSTGVTRIQVCNTDGCNTAAAIAGAVTLSSAVATLTAAVLAVLIATAI